MSMIEATALSRTFGGLKAVEDFSIRVESGEVVGLIGPNGAGKTTSFNLLTGQIKPTSGEVTLDGERITGKPPWELARRGVARTFQHAATFPALTVRENIRIVLAARSVIPRRDRAERTAEVLSEVAPDAPLEGIIGDLPYGVQRRVAIAIALANRPSFLMLDEPAAGLNPAETAALGDVIEQTAARGVGVLLVEHDLELVTRIVSRLEVLSAGRTLFSGTAAAAMSDPTVMAAYIGRGASKSD